MVNKIQTEYWDQLSKEIETAIINHNRVTTYEIIRELKGGKQNIENSSIQDENE